MTMRSQQGISLIELMVSVAVGLLLVSGMIGLYVSQSQGSRQFQSYSRMQENARFAFELIGRDLRMVGNTGCYRNATANTLDAGIKALWYGAVDVQALIGYEDADTSAPTTNGLRGNVLRGDALAVLRVDDESPYEFATAAPGVGPYTLTTAPANLAVDDIVLATDCQTATVSKVTGVGGTVVTVAAPGATAAYVANSRLYPLSGHLYYIRNNDAGNPALYRQEFNAGSTAGVEMVEGIEDMQIEYGVDTTGVSDTDGDGSVDTYVKADQVEATAPGTTAARKWTLRVLSVRVSLLIRSQEDNIATNAQSFTGGGEPDWPFDVPTVVDDGAAAVAQDRRLRRQFTATFALRGRVP